MTEIERYPDGERFERQLDAALSTRPAPSHLAGRILSAIDEPEFDGRVLRRWALPGLAMAAVCLVAGFATVQLTVDPLITVASLVDGVGFEPLSGDWTADDLL